MRPLCVLILSGKRKSGKDFLTEHLLKKIGNDVASIVRLSAPIKNHWAKSHNLNFAQLLDSSVYKEEHRLAMIQWSEEERAKDYGIFCRLAAEDAENTNKKVWIVSDARRKTDLRWFREQYTNSIIKTIRVIASEEVRIKRGWTFQKGVDDVASECGLDDVLDWDLEVINDGTLDTLNTPLEQLAAWVNEACK